MVDKWNETDKTCPHCGQVTERAKGLNKQNLKRLLTPKFDMTELIVTALLILIIVAAYSYNREVKTCREWIKPMFESDKAHCRSVCSERCEALEFNNVVANFTVPVLNVTNAYGT